MKDQQFIEALAQESDYPLSEEILRFIIDNSQEVKYGKGEALIDFGSYNPHIYIIKKGIVRGYMDFKGKETNIYFGLEGTLVNSMQCFSFGEPSIIKIETCIPTTVLRIFKSDYDRMIKESKNFNLWICGVFSRRNAFAELKAKIMDGDSEWRYKWLEKCRPELLDNVPLKAIASYLNMTEVHVSRIRKKIAEKKSHGDAGCPPFS